MGHSVGNIGLCATNDTFPVSTVLQAAGTGIGTRGAVCYSISVAEKREQRTRNFMADTLWILVICRVILTVLTFGFITPIL